MFFGLPPRLPFFLQDSAFRSDFLLPWYLAYKLLCSDVGLSMPFSITERLALSIIISVFLSAHDPTAPGLLVSSAA